MVKSNYSYISGKDVIRELGKQYGCDIVFQKGSHIKVVVGGKKTVIPNHKQLAYGTFSAILKQLGIDEERFLDEISK